MNEVLSNREIPPDNLGSHKLVDGVTSQGPQTNISHEASQQALASKMSAQQIIEGARVLRNIQDRVKKTSPSDTVPKDVAIAWDVYRAKQHGFAAIQRLERQLTGEDFYRAEELIYQVKTSSAQETERQVKKEAKNIIRRLSHEDRQYFGIATEQSAAGFKEHALALGLTIGTDITSRAELNGFAALTGAALAHVNPLEHVDPKFALAATVVSYGTWFWGIGQNFKPNWQALQETGVSTSTISKAGYEMSKKITDNEKVQQIITSAGYVALDAVEEFPWLIAAFSAGYVTGIENLGYSFMVGANIGAAVYEKGKAMLTQGVLDNREDLPKKAQKVLSNGVKLLIKMLWVE